MSWFVCFLFFILLVITGAHKLLVIFRNSPRSIKKRVFSHDVTVAILVSQNNEAAAMLVSQTTPVLNSFLMQTLSFVPINLHGCWPRE